MKKEKTNAPLGPDDQDKLGAEDSQSTSSKKVVALPLSSSLTKKDPSEFFLLHSKEVSQKTYSFVCVKNSTFTYSIYHGNGWSLSCEIKEGCFMENASYNLTTSVDGAFYCPELDITFKSDYIEGLIRSKTLVLLN